MTASRRSDHRAPPRRDVRATRRGRKRDILVAAREEFVEHGLDGARVDRIAERAGANKRMLYHYVGNKEALYARVLLDAYRDIRAGEAELHLGELAAGRGDGAARRLHLRPLPRRTPGSSGCSPPRTSSAAPSCASCRTSARCTRRSSPRSPRCSPPARPAGVFRPGVDPVQLYITIAGVSYFYMSNIHTLSVDLRRRRWPRTQTWPRGGPHAIEVVLGYLRPGESACDEITKELLSSQSAAKGARDPTPSGPDIRAPNYGRTTMTRD